MQNFIAAFKSQETNWVAIISVWFDVASLTGAYFYMRYRKIKLEIRNKAITNRLTELEETVKLKFPTSVLFRNELASRLTHHRTPEADALLKKLVLGTLGEDEKQLLLVFLHDRETDIEADEEERSAARMMPEVIKQAERDIKNDGGNNGSGSG